jgi:hypothetical protein
MLSSTFIRPLYSEPLKVFYSYAQDSSKDSILLDLLDKHLTSLKHSKRITSWDKRLILPGGNIEDEVINNLNNSNLIIILLSADYISSTKLFLNELKEAIKKHKNGRIKLIPIILRPVDIEPVKETLEGVSIYPENNIPISLWNDIDSAFSEIATIIRKIVENWDYIILHNPGASLQIGVKDNAGENEIPANEFDLLLPSEGFTPVLLRGLKINKNSTNLDFLVDNTEFENGSDWLKAETKKLINYFAASLSIRQDDLWVNLSAFEDSRTIPKVLEGTEMGKDMLQFDCLLKLLTASLMHPNTAIGKEYWNAVFDRVYKKNKSSNFQINTFQKVWIASEKVSFYEKEVGVEMKEIKNIEINKDDRWIFQVDHTIKVYQQKDNLAIENHLKGTKKEIDSFFEVQEICSDEFEKRILPVIEKEVNCGKNFSTIRQILNALGYAAWVKKSCKDDKEIARFIDTNKPEALTPTIHFKDSGNNIFQNKPHSLKNPFDHYLKDRINLSGEKDDFRKLYYNLYLKLFKEGIFSCTKIEYDNRINHLITRTYFSGGFDFRKIL